MSRTGELDETVPSDSDAERSATAPASAKDEPAPKTISRFVITSTLGTGGMGTVLLATDPLLGRNVALKVMRDGATADDDRQRRFLREAQAMAKLVHENVIVVHEVGTYEGRVYIAMEHVAGRTLARWQVDRDWREVVDVYARAGRGLVTAHDAGLVHRDFKPDNVLIGDDGRVRVTDFGLVAAIDSALAEPPAEDRARDLELGTSLTRTGAVMGTPRYMAPEQHLGDTVDARADQFAFCVALYEALYHQAPYAGDGYSELATNVLAGDLRPPPTSDVPVALRDAVLRGLSRDRADRFASMHELLAVLRDVRAPARSRRQRWIMLVVAVIALGLIAAIAYKIRAANERADRLAVEIVQLKSQRDAQIGSGSGSGSAHPLNKMMEHARLEFDEAQANYVAGRYDAAVKGFMAAYDFQKDATFLYNAAAASHMRGKKDHDATALRQAVTLYRRYLDESPNAKDREKVTRAITAIEQASGR